MVAMVLVSLLGLLSVSQAAIESDIVKSYPGTNTTELGFELYSGLLDLPNTGGKKMHYVFATSQSPTNATDPVVLWLTGGPGCSSLSAFSYENGPFYFEAGQTYLVKNEYAWNKVANFLWFESPPGVGFSEFGTDHNVTTDDEITTENNLQALILFFQGFEEFVDNEFFISGESYGGVYVPFLADAIVRNNNNFGQKINLKGFLIGNGLTSQADDLGNDTYANFMWWHALYGQETRDEYEASCTIDQSSEECQQIIAHIGNLTTNINPYDIYKKCWHENVEDVDPLLASRFPERYSKKLRNDPNGIPCIDLLGSTTYWNDKTARNAFNVGSSQVVWNTCIFPPDINYIMSPGQSIQRYPDLIESDLRILFYSGDCDSTIATTGSRKWFDGLQKSQGYNITDEWRQWYLDGQVGGYTEEMNSNFRFATIKGTGHMSIQWKRPQGFYLYSSFLNNTKF